jgi:hypothetical protein
MPSGWPRVLVSRGIPDFGLTVVSPPVDLAVAKMELGATFHLDHLKEEHAQERGLRVEKQPVTSTSVVFAEAGVDDTPSFLSGMARLLRHVVVIPIHNIISEHRGSSHRNRVP